MNEDSKSLDQLLAKLDDLTKRQELFSKQINEIRNEIQRLKSSSDVKVTAKQEEPIPNYIKEKYQVKELTEETENQPVNLPDINQKQHTKDVTAKFQQPVKIKKDLEKFIGENLLSKIGIIITVVGVAIGVKYSIEHQLISPLTRIILGYLSGAILLGFGIKLKKKYTNYSAVLVSGALAILYFITYAAYSFYQLLPQVLSFGIMVVVTVFAVYLAMNYNKQIIAHFGLVGAYAVPFLLSENSGNVTILYTYMSIINAGILTISFIKYWKPLYYSSFLLTWLMYFVWYQLSYDSAELFEPALTFLSIFFAIFYISFLAYKLRKNRNFEREDIILVLSNAFIFYGLGYSILADHETGKQLLGLFTIGNAAIHFLAAILIYRQKFSDKNLFYLILGIVLVFVTIAIPVQLNGNWVTLLWAGEAALLFGIGRTRRTGIYESLSYPVMLLAFLSLIQDWGTGPYLSQPQADITPLLNIHFLTSMLFLAAFGFVLYLFQNKKYVSALNLHKDIWSIISTAIPAIFLFSLYFSFRMEIASFFQQQFSHSGTELSPDGQLINKTSFNTDLLKFKILWINNYSILFLSLLSIINIRKLKNKNLGFVNLGFNVWVVVVFLIQDLYILGQLREIYLADSSKEIIYIGIRYISLAFVALMIFTCYHYIKQGFLKNDFKFVFDLFLYTSILWIASSELIHWMDLLGSSDSYKLGLSILWGVYAMLIISLGIWKKKKYLRIGAIALFAGTLIKLFFYDLTYLDTISKTIVFVSLGLLLLFASFLYNKYKILIS